MFKGCSEGAQLLERCLKVLVKVHRGCFKWLKGFVSMLKSSIVFFIFLEFHVQAFHLFNSLIRGSQSWFQRLVNLPYFQQSNKSCLLFTRVQASSNIEKSFPNPSRTFLGSPNHPTPPMVAQNGTTNLFELGWVRAGVIEFIPQPSLPLSFTVSNK